MIIRCWGSRGSISVSGAEYLKYGGDTTCIEVVADSGETIIIDAGTGIRALGNRLVREKNRQIHLFLTHAHWDHLSGFPFFKPIYNKDTEIRIHGPESTQSSLKGIISKTMTSPYFPIEFEDIHANINFPGPCVNGCRIGSIKVTTIPLSHPNQGVGYRLEEGGKSFVFLTDNELTHRHPTGVPYEEYVRFAKDADILFHDSEFRRDEYAYTKGWGHSVYLDTLNLALEANVKMLGLFHHNQDRVDREVDAIELECRSIIKERGSKLKCVAIPCGYEIKL